MIVTHDKSPPEMTPLLIIGKVIFQNAPISDVPRLLAASSTEIGIWPSIATELLMV